MNKQEGGGEARFEIVFDEARVVKQVFAWVGETRCAINEVCRRLHQAAIRTQTGKEHWDHKTIWDMLKNPAYKGEAALAGTARETCAIPAWVCGKRCPKARVDYDSCACDH